MSGYLDGEISVVLYSKNLEVHIEGGIDRENTLVILSLEQLPAVIEALNRILDDKKKHEKVQL